MLRYAAPLAIALATPITAETTGDPVHDMAHFFRDATILAGPELVDCTLSGGTQTTCVSITLKPEPVNATPGPWCPSNISEGAEAGGIWLEDGAVNDVSGAFIENLATFYGDDRWQMFDPATGAINVTDSAESCAAAARPDVDEAYTNYCVQCELDYLDPDLSLTFVIPVEQIPAAQPTPTNRAGSGVAFTGVRLDGPAPVDAILGAFTLAPFDDCGGHVNLNVGYHYHAATDCLDATAEPSEHANQIGIAMDGYAIFANLLSDGTAPTDLDACHGHATDAEGYHYHAGAAGSNQILGCHIAETGCVLTDPNGTCDATDMRPPRP